LSPTPDKVGVLSFVMNGHRAEDNGSALNEEGIAVRAGHHCAQPILRRFGVESTASVFGALQYLRRYQCTCRSFVEDRG
jgi:selenocysteine lyase/cysteine desulfurase